MAESNARTNTNNATNGKKRRHHYQSFSKPTKKKGQWPLKAGVEGFFITCDGGRERQASNEALNILDSFYEELVQIPNSAPTNVTNKHTNKVIKFTDTDSSDEDDESPPKKEGVDLQNEANDTEDAPSKKQRVDVEADEPKCETANHEKSEAKPIDELIEDELKELGDKKKRHFLSLDSGCNGCIFIQMNRRTGDPSPTDIVQHIMSSAASTRKHMSRFILRILPVEVASYASEEEISKAIKPLIDQHFPTEAPTPKKFAVLYEARSNTGIERMAIINAVAKSVPQPHKVDLNNPDKTIIVQIAKKDMIIA
ncbi:hypothetical protein QJS04_geneDACA023855 [Acorus gramineus]|uniref:THUMP domain-containing protein n=1 Tax=Acorus gramineus TaxID=55184 RepID=A0AAV9BPY9_ACOGR|nr:hypothetical protein QJS04_geneDACA023855 [Acorus gramineus]